MPMMSQGAPVIRDSVRHVVTETADRVRDRRLTALGREEVSYLQGVEDTLRFLAGQPDPSARLTHAIRED